METTYNYNITAGPSAPWYRLTTPWTAPRLRHVIWTEMHSLVGPNYLCHPLLPTFVDRDLAIYTALVTVFVALLCGIGPLRRRMDTTAGGDKRADERADKAKALEVWKMDMDDVDDFYKRDRHGKLMTKLPPELMRTYGPHHNPQAEPDTEDEDEDKAHKEFMDKENELGERMDATGTRRRRVHRGAYGTASQSPSRFKSFPPPRPRSTIEDVNLATALMMIMEEEDERQRLKEAPPRKRYSPLARFVILWTLLVGWAAWPYVEKMRGVCVCHPCVWEGERIFVWPLLNS